MKSGTWRISGRETSSLPLFNTEVMGVAARRTRGRRFWSNLVNGPAARYLFILPTILFILIFLGYPLIQSIYISFTDASLLRPDVNRVGLKNYAQLLSDRLFWLSLRHSFQLTFTAVALQAILGLGLAVLLNQKVPGIQIFRNIALVTWVIPIAATVVLFSFAATPEYGLFNVLLKQIGLGDLQRYWFGNRDTAMWMIILMHVWRNAPFYALALLAAMQAIPQTLYEAAQVDGANAWQRFWVVTFPYIRYTLGVMIVLHVIFTFNNFEFVFLSTGGGPVRATEVLPTYIFEQSWQYYRLGYAAAIGVAMMLILLTITLISVRLMERARRS